MSAKASQNLMPMPHVKVSGGIPTLTVQSQQRYINLGKKIYQHAKQELASGNFTKQSIYKNRTPINRLDRQLNNLRKKLSSPYVGRLKSFKKQIDAIIVYPKRASKLYSKELKIFQDQTREKLKSHLSDLIDLVCHNRNINSFPVPAECLKLSLSHRQRLNIIVQIADLKVADQHRRATKPIGDKMIDTISHQVVGKAVNSHVKFYDSEDKYIKLIKFAVANHIDMHFPNENKYLVKIKQADATNI